jgi:hypothetical protein
MVAETEIAGAQPVPDDVDLAGATALLESGTVADGGEHAAAAAGNEGEETRPVGDGEPNAERDDAPDLEVESEQQVAADDEPPAFWSADDRAAWQAVPRTLRPVIAKYEQQRIAFVNERAREAAQAREEAGRVAQTAAGIVEQSAAWWQQNGPAFQQAFADKWAGVDWNKLAEESPAEWTRLKQQRDNEAALLLEAERRGQADVALANQRAEQALIETRRVEHAKLAARLPQYFGPDVAARTYDELGKFLFAKGIPADRINAIHEAPIIELALAAMRFEEAQKLALQSRQSRPSEGGDAGSTAKTTPTRVAPGPAGRTGNRTGDAARQVGERFRKSGGASIADAAELIRLSGL